MFEFFLLGPTRRTRCGLTTLAESLCNIGCLPFGVANLFFILTRNKRNSMSLRLGRTDSETSVFGKVLRTSRKLAAAKNFLAVALCQEKNEKSYWVEEDSTPCRMRISVFVVGICKNFESKVLDVRRTDGFNIDSIVRTDLRLYFFKSTEEGFKEIARSSSTSIDADTEVRSIVSTCKAKCRLDWVFCRQIDLTNTSRRLRDPVFRDLLHEREKERRP